MAKIITKANAFFGDDGPPRDRIERLYRKKEIAKDKIDLWGKLDQEFYAYPDDIGDLQGKYLNDHWHKVPFSSSSIN